MTPDERLKVRSLLDKHFDDAKGRYLDGYSDQKVATEANVPRIHVETIRETAYGAIKADGELDKIRAEMLGMAKTVQEVSGRLSALTKRVDEILEEIR